MIKMDVVSGRVPTHDIVHFPGLSDQQCTLDCVAAAIYTWKKLPVYWKSTDLDVIVNKSTLLYQSLMKQNQTVHVNNIPGKVHIYGDQFQITQCLPSRALTEPGYETCLKSRLHNLIVPGLWNCHLLKFTRDPDKKEYSCLLIANSSTNIYLFDPHSTNIIGQPTENGTCALMYSHTIENCIAHICKIVSHHKLTQYNIIPIIIENMDTKTSIDDEIRKIIKRKEDKRREDKKLHIRKKRQEAKITKEKELSSMPSNDPQKKSVHKIRTVHANRHQGDAIYKFSGRQCMTNCAVSLILAHRLNPMLWSTTHLDNILYYGDCLYRATNKDELLSPADIPRHAHVFNTNYIIYETGSTIGAFKSCPQGDYGITLNQLDSILKASSYFILCMHDTSISIIKDAQNTYHIFDPHSRDNRGLPCPDGKAIVLTFPTIRMLKAHIETLHVHSNCKRSTTCHFEISPFNIFEDVQFVSDDHTRKINSNCTSNSVPHGNLGAYFADQRKKTLEKKECHTATRNTEYLSKGHNKPKHSICKKEDVKKLTISKKCIQQPKEHTTCHESSRSQKISTPKLKPTSKGTRHVHVDTHDEASINTVQLESVQVYGATPNSTCELGSVENDINIAEKSDKRGRKRKYRLDPEMYAGERERNAASIKRRRLNDNTFLQKGLQNSKLYLQNKRKNSDYKDHAQYMKKCKKIEAIGSLHDAIMKFHSLLEYGCMYVCSVCQQTNFYEYMTVVTPHDVENNCFLKKCITGYKSFDDKEYICNTCKCEIRKNSIPKLSIINKCGFPQKPPELNINQLEEICVSPLIPFMTLRQLPRGFQKAIKGNVCHIPIEIGETLNMLPRTYSDMHTVPVDFKRRRKYKSSVCSENIRPTVILKAVKYLITHSEMYKHRNIHIDPDWLSKIETDTGNPYVQLNSRGTSTVETDEDESVSSGSDDDFVEVEESIRNAGNKDTILQNDVTDVQTLRYTFAPGEDKLPIFNEPLAEYLCFPTIFCGQTRPENSERLRPVHISDIFKYELRNVDERVCLNIPNIFWKAKHLQVKQMLDKVSLAVRRNKSKGSKKITAALLCDETERNNLVKCDEGFHIFRTVRSSPAYFEGKKKELLSMVRQLGIPTFFFSLSSADTNWPSLLKCLGRLVDKKDYSDDYIENEMTWVDKNRLVASHPAICCRFFNYRVNKFFSQLICGHHNPLGPVKDYFWRVEFQQRGSPHIHGVLWVQDAPIFRKDNDTDVCTYIDKYISCSSDVSKEESKWVNLQTHKHSKSCKRRRGKKEICRFGVPWPPMRSTQILYPLENDESVAHTIAHTYYEEMYSKIYQYLASLGSDPPKMSFDDLLSNLDISEEVYIKSICSSLRKPKVFLKREVCDIRVNPYMKHLVSAWQANHDIQYVLDTYSCVVYICDYMTKSQKGISTVMAEACKETKRGNYTIKQSVKHMANKFLNASETSIMECCYDILQLPITQSTRKREFISTNKQEDRIFIAKSNKILKNLPPTSTDVKLASNIDKYAKRPKELSSWCLADFVAELDISYEKSSNKEEDSEYEDDQECLSESEGIDISDEASDTLESKSCVFPLKKHGLVYRKRQKRKVIRFVNYRLGSDSENYYRERLLLYTAWRNEEELLNCHSSYADAFKSHENTIKRKMNIYEPLSASLDEAIEEVHLESHILDDINPSIHEPDDPSEANVPSTYDYFDPDRPEFQRSFDIGGLIGCSTDKFVDSTRQRENYMADEAYKEVLRSLNKEQQEFYTHIMHLASTSDEQITCCLHGGAGTGKSHVIKALYQGLYRLLCTSPGENPDICKIMIVAPTGRAAYNVNGSTIHSVFHIPVNQKVVYKPLPHDLQNSYRAKYQHLQWLIIDEISMVGERTHNFLECRLRELKQSTKPYGGVNIVAIGDFYQLKPVQDNYIFHEPTEGYAILGENLWRKHFRFFNLTEIMRQKDDKTFAEVLNRIRVNKHTVEDIKLIKTRNITANEAVGLTHIPRFFPTRKMVDDYNASQRTASTNVFTSTALDILPTNINKHVETILRKKIENRKKAETTAGLSREVELAVDEQFDIIANINVADGLLNGTQCRIRHIQENKNKHQLPDIVWVTFVEGDGNIGQLQREKYNYLHRMFNKPDSWTPIFAIRRTYTVDNQTVTRIQFPLRHAAARTIHVAQGGTYDSIVINLDTVQKPPAHWWEHVHYVALSRVTHLEGLHILGLNESRIRASHEVTHYLEDECASNALLCYVPLYTVQPPSLKIVYNNVGSLRHKIEDIKGNYNMTSADIICLAETWLPPHQLGTSYDIPYYRKFCTDLVHGYHGMVMYISDNINIEHMDISASTDIEIITLTVNKLDTLINIVALYCAPNVPHRNIYKSLQEALSKVNLHMHTILIGDFNIDVSGDKNNKLLNTMKIAFNMTQLITHSTTHEQTIIDLVFSNKPCNYTQALTNYWSMHKILSVVVNINN